jgi:hypothetical protein
MMSVMFDFDRNGVFDFGKQSVHLFERFSFVVQKMH